MVGTVTDTTYLQNSGNSAARVDIALVSEGYTAGERALFLSDAQNFMNYLFSTTTRLLSEPFYSYRSFINVTANFISSSQSGYDLSGNLVNTAFDAAAYLVDNRLVYGDTLKVFDFLSPLTSTSSADLILVLVNSSNYGGAGGAVAWTTSRNNSSYEIALHEIGHSFARLQDEYVDVNIQNQFPLSAIANSVHVSTSSNPTEVNWKAWIGFQDSLGTVGVYEGGYYRTTGVWRATQDSKMLNFGVAFSAPQKEAFISRFYDLVGDYLHLNSRDWLNFSASTVDNGSFNFDWRLNGNTIQSGPISDFGMPAYLKTINDGSYSLILNVVTTDRLGMLRDAAVIAKSTQLESRTIDLFKSSLTDGPDFQNYNGGNNYFVTAGAGDDVVSFSNNGNFNTYVEAGLGDDSLTGGIGLDLYAGNGGNDTLDGGLGADTALFAGLRAQYQITKTAGGYQVRDLTANRDGTDQLSNMEIARFSDRSVDFTVAAAAAGVNAGQLKTLLELYVGFFNRIPEAAGVKYWIDQLKATNDLTGIANQFYAAGVQFSAQTGYSATMTNAEFITKVYANVLGRSGATAPNAGEIAYWNDRLVSGADTKGSMVLTMISNVHQFFTNDPTWGFVASLLTNKSTVANTYAIQQGLSYNTPEENITQGMAMAAAVTPTSTAAAIALIGVSDVFV